MAVNNKTTDEQQENEFNRSYNFMVNILESEKHRKIPVPFLEKILTDNKIPLSRLLTGLGLEIFVVTAFFLFPITQAPAMAGYVFLPLLFVTVALTVLVLFYIAPYDAKTVLSVSANLAFNNFLEKIRLKSNDTSLKTYGIYKVYDGGTIRFSNGDFGALYKVSGHLGHAVLPRVADQLSVARAKYMIAKKSDTQEQFLMFIEPVDVSSQIKMLNNVVKSAKESNDEDSDNALFREYMAKIYKEYLNSRVKETDTTITQYVIIRSSSTALLRESMDLFAAFVEGYGIYSKSMLIDSKKEVESVLSDPFKN